jgi:thiamine biosynthesis protein ThiI
MDQQNNKNNHLGVEPLSNPDHVVCHYDEIGLKGGNRWFFEDKLVEDIKRKLPASNAALSVRKERGRIVIKINDASAQEEITEALKRVFGIANFAFAYSCELNLGTIKERVLEILDDGAKDTTFVTQSPTFRITAIRSNKKFPTTSQKTNEEIGAYIVEKLELPVNLENPDLNCFIEITDNEAFLYLQKISGPGGLPAGCEGKVGLLMSGGIDSPVAAFQLMRRGAKIIFIHFHSVPFTSEESAEKTKGLVSQLAKFQPKSKLYLVPFADIQKQILLKTPEPLRIVLYRRFMFKIAEQIAETENISALATGESLGQVASQTLENMRVIEDAVTIPILRPLIGMDKKDIIIQAKEIGTYEISVQPHQDCCSLFVPKHPATKSRTEDAEGAEEKLDDIEKTITETIQKAEIVFLG